MFNLNPQEDDELLDAILFQDLKNQAMESEKDKRWVIREMIKITYKPGEMVSIDALAIIIRIGFEETIKADCIKAKMAPETYAYKLAEEICNDKNIFFHLNGEGIFKTFKRVW